ncbi:MAG: hypothetical protein LAT64_01870 [Phycisphaerales bacterium]|nr:hypothetical protein [Planctomycetota bacterium]MCH8507507.1 hypothetical protein [Phycisphaerales bacterium]
MALLFTLATLVVGAQLMFWFPSIPRLHTFVPAVVVVAFGLGLVFDAKRTNKQAARSLTADGFEPCEGACDPDIELLAEAMKPSSLRPDYAEIVLTGERCGRTVYLANYWTGESRYAFAAVQTVRRWPEAIIRRKRITGNLRDGHDLGDRAFNRQREILSKAPAEAMQPFEHLAGWFVNDDTVRKSFRMHEIPGKNEQWAFGGHWVALADRGHAGPKQLLQLADFLVAFAEAADALDDPVAAD